MIKHLGLEATPIIIHETLHHIRWFDVWTTLFQRNWKVWKKATYRSPVAVICPWIRFREQCTSNFERPYWLLLTWYNPRDQSLIRWQTDVNIQGAIFAHISLVNVISDYVGEGCSATTNLVSPYMFGMTIIVHICSAKLRGLSGYAFKRGDRL